MKNRIRMARGSNISSNVSTIAKGQPVYDIDKHIIKVGTGKDGETTVANTPALSLEDSAILGTPAQSPTNTTSRKVIDIFETNTNSVKSANSLKLNNDNAISLTKNNDTNKVDSTTFGDLLPDENATSTVQGDVTTTTGRNIGSPTKKFDNMYAQSYRGNLIGDVSSQNIDTDALTANTLTVNSIILNI